MDQDMGLQATGAQPAAAVGLAPIPDDWDDQAAHDSTEDGNGPEEKNSKLALLIGTAVVLALLLGGVFAYHMFFSNALR